MHEARQLWVRLETLHAVTYFGEETQAAVRGIGVDGFWRGYFGLRAAPLGSVAAGTVVATFANFAPSFVARWVPDVWDVAPPDALLAVRASAAAATLRRVVPDLDAVAVAVLPALAAAVERAPVAGRPLFAANRDLDVGDDPVAALWQRCTQLREHRGDGHVAALAAAGIDGLEAHVLLALDQGADPVDLQKARGWTPEDWAEATDRLRSRGLVDGGVSADGEGDDRLSEAGAAVRAEVEATTDLLAERPWAPLPAAERVALLEVLAPAATAVARSGVLRYPNPIGLPPAG